MKLRVISDLHCEYSGYLQGIPFSLEEGDEDVFILAGDIVNATPTGIRFLKGWLRGYSKPIIYVPGNHEHYRCNFRETVLTLTTSLQENPNLYVMDMNTIEIDGITFIGATLWSKLAHHIKPSLHTCHSDFSKITEMSVSVYDMAHKFAVEYLEIALTNLREVTDNVVVITHHAPSFLSQEEKYKGWALESAFNTDMTDMMLRHNPKLWIHGHTHSSYDYLVGETRVVCNAYTGNRNFDKSLIIEV